MCVCVYLQMLGVSVLSWQHTNTHTLTRTHQDQFNNPIIFKLIFGQEETCVCCVSVFSSWMDVRWDKTNQGTNKTNITDRIWCDLSSSSSRKLTSNELMINCSVLRQQLNRDVLVHGCYLLPRHTHTHTDKAREGGRIEIERKTRLKWELLNI